MSVSRKVLASVSVAVLTGVSVGVVGVVSLDSAADAAAASYQQSPRALLEVGEMRAQFLGLQLNTALAYIQDQSGAADAAEYRQAAAAAGVAVGDAGQRYQATKPTSAQLRTARTLNDTYAKFNDLNEQMTAATAAGDATTAVTVYNQTRELLPIIGESIDTLLASETVEASEAADAVADTASSARTTLIAVVVAGALIALGLGWAVARGIRRTLQSVQHVAEGIAAGDLTRSTGIDQRDELGQTAAALRSEEHTSELQSRQYLVC